MKYLLEYKIFERKGNYQLFHKTSNLKGIITSGNIICGGDEGDVIWWNVELRKNVFPNWKKDDKKFKTISATRNLDYINLPALELDVEKISDKYRIVPFSENPDFYLDFKGDKWGNSNKEKSYKPNKNKNLTKFQNQLRSKNAGELYWRTKTDIHAWDYGIAEELILTDKLDVGKYVKRIILDKNGYKNKDLIKLINKKYPHIEVVEIEKGKGSRSFNYMDVKKASTELQNQKELVLQESVEEPNFKIGDIVYAINVEHCLDLESNTPYEIIDVFPELRYQFKRTYRLKGIPNGRYVEDRFISKEEWEFQNNVKNYNL